MFGRDDAGRTHASTVDASEAELAEKAAGLMGMRVLPITSPHRAALAAGLPRGRIFESGRGFIPFCKAELFAKLEKAPGAFTPAGLPDAAAEVGPGEPKGGPLSLVAGQPTGDQQEAADGAPRPLADWGSIGVGSPVLAAGSTEST